MSGTVAECIVGLFHGHVTEIHRKAVQATLKITAEHFDQNIARARDLGVDKGLHITPIYERDGWWTARPTQRIAAIAVHETLKRQLGEAERHARVYADFGKLDGFTTWHRAATSGTLTAYLEQLSEVEISAAADYVLTDIDAALPLLYVLRNDEGLRAAA